MNITNTNQPKKARRKISTKTLRRNDFVRNLFKDRTSPRLGLTKKEIVSIVFSLPKAKVDKMKNDELLYYIEKFKDTKKRLRKDGIIAITPIQLNAGVELNDVGLDNSVGIRFLKNKEYVYHRCTDINIAKDYKNKMNKVAKGVVESGVETEEMTDKIIKEIKILNELKIRN
jgi:hypothetical protein